MRERIAVKRIEFLGNQEIKRVVHTYAGRICAKRFFEDREFSIFTRFACSLSVYGTRKTQTLY